MESAWLAPAAAGAAAGDPARRARHSPPRAASPAAHRRRGTRAYRTLRGRARWSSDGRGRSAAARSCSRRRAPRAPGVVRAVEVVERALEERGAPVYVRKQIVHNTHVVAELERRGAVFVEEVDEVPAGATVVFSAHGVSPAVRAEAAARGLDVIDATCPLVAKVHAEARRFAAAGLRHRPDRPRGARGGRRARSVRRRSATHVVASAEEVELLEVGRPERVAYLTQTTLAVDETDARRRARCATGSRRSSVPPRTTSATRPRTARTLCARSRATATSCSSSARATRRTPGGWSRSPSARAAARAAGRATRTTRAGLARRGSTGRRDRRRVGARGAGRRRRAGAGRPRRPVTASEARDAADDRCRFKFPPGPQRRSR